MSSINCSEKGLFTPKLSSSGLHIIILRKKKKHKKGKDFNLGCSGCSEKTTVITRINKGRRQTHNMHTDSNHCVVLLCSCSNEVINSFYIDVFYEYFYLYVGCSVGIHVGPSAFQRHTATQTYTQHQLWSRFQ